MNRVEFEEKLKEYNLERIYHNGYLKTYENEQKMYYRDQIRENIYGCYKSNKEYVIFFSDAERGIITELGRFFSEEDAFTNLLKILKKWKKEEKEEQYKKDQHGNLKVKYIKMDDEDSSL